MRIADEANTDRDAGLEAVVGKLATLLSYMRRRAGLRAGHGWLADPD